MSGLPSTAYALATGRDPLEGTLAAGSLVAGSSARRSVLVTAAVPVHLALSVGWGTALARLGVRSVRAGVFAGGVIALVDLGLVGRHFARVRALPLAPQVADHVVYGAIVGFVLSRSRGAAQKGRRRVFDRRFGYGPARAVT